MSSLASALESNVHMPTNKLGLAVNSVSNENLHKNLLQRKLSLDDDPDGWCQIYHMKRNDSLTSTNSQEKLTLWENSKGFQAENIHLYLSDLLISSVEQMKWREHTKNIDFTTDPGPILQPEASSSSATAYDQPSTSTGIYANSSSEKRTGNSIFYADVDEIKEELQAKTSSDSVEGYVSSEGELHEDPTSDEVISALMKYFENKQKERMEKPEDFVCMVSFADAPQNLLPIPNEIPVPPDEIYTVDGKRIRLRGSTMWAPPKKKFIFDLVKTSSKDRQKLLSMQNYRCAGCGMKMNNLYADRSRICHYYNKVFCQCCHQGAKTRIPARILHQWNFSEFEVSDMAYKFLKDNEEQPVYDIRAINNALYKKVHNLRKFKEIRIKASHMWQYIKLCPVSDRTLTNFGNLKTMFTSVPNRFLMLEYVDFYSLLDFDRVRNGNLLEMFEPTVMVGGCHIENCMHCEQRAFLCQICMKPNSYLFSFQLDQVHRCDGCGALSHLKCYQKIKKSHPDWKCARCERIEKKKIRQEHSSSDDSYHSD